MSARWIVEFQTKGTARKPGEWIKVGTFDSKPEAEEESRKVAKKRGRTTRVRKRLTLGEVWRMNELRSRLGFEPAGRELKKRCEAGAIAACGMYASQVKQWIRVALQEPEPAGRTPVNDALIICGEDETVRKIEEIHASGKPITSKIVVDLQEEWLNKFKAKVGRDIPGPYDLTEKEKEESKRIAIKMHALPAKPAEVKPPEKPKEEKLEELEAMKKALEERIKKMKGE